MFLKSKFIDSFLPDSKKDPTHNCFGYKIFLERLFFRYQNVHFLQNNFEKETILLICEYKILPPYLTANNEVIKYHSFEFLTLSNLAFHNYEQ